MKTKTTMKYYFISGRMAIIKKKKVSVGEDVKKRELSYTVCGNVNQYNHYENTMKFPQKNKK